MAKTVLLVNGSPHAQGCTYTALSEVEKELHAAGVETAWFQLGTAPVQGCVACHKCSQLKKCVFDDKANELAGLLRGADGVVFGSPVYFASANGSFCALLDRVFYFSMGDLAYKPGAAIVSCRRGGASAAFDRLNKYLTISRMLVVGSQYWNAVHGHTPDEVRQDLEGLQIMRTLGKNMAWTLKNLEAGKAAGVEIPAAEPRVGTNFIR